MDFDIMTAAKQLSPSAIGAALAAWTGPSRKKAERVLEFLIGCTVSALSTGPILHWLKLEPGVYWSIVAFTMGFCGLSIYAKFRETISGIDINSMLKDYVKSVTGNKDKIK